MLEDCVESSSLASSFTNNSATYLATLKGQCEEVMTCLSHGRGTNKTSGEYVASARLSSVGLEAVNQNSLYMGVLLIRTIIQSLFKLEREQH